MVTGVKRNGTGSQHLTNHLRIPLCRLEAGKAKAEAWGIADVEVQVGLACVEPEEGLRRAHGEQVQIGGKAYQLVQLDSGATASTAGAPVCGSLAFWKSRANYIVTTDKIQAEGANQNTATVISNVIANTVNSIAGVFCQTASGANVAGTASLTAGNYGVIQQRGPHVGVLTSSGSAVNGDLLIGLTTGAPPGALRVASGTALVSQLVGRATAATSAVTTNYTPAVLGSSDLVDVP